MNLPSNSRGSIASQHRPFDLADGPKRSPSIYEQIVGTPRSPRTFGAAAIPSNDVAMYLDDVDEEIEDDKYFINDTVTTVVKALKPIKITRKTAPFALTVMHLAIWLLCFWNIRWVLTMVDKACDVPVIEGLSDILPAPLDFCTSAPLPEVDYERAVNSYGTFSQQIEEVSTVLETFPVKLVGTFYEDIGLDVTGSIHKKLISLDQLYGAFSKFNATNVQTSTKLHDLADGVEKSIGLLKHAAKNVKRNQRSLIKKRKEESSPVVIDQSVDFDKILGSYNELSYESQKLLSNIIVEVKAAQEFVDGSKKVMILLDEKMARFKEAVETGPEPGVLGKALGVVIPGAPKPLDVAVLKGLYWRYDEAKTYLQNIEKVAKKVHHEVERIKVNGDES